MFYIWIISLIFYRYTFLSFSPGDLAPPYWINMGAMAISTLAGAQLAQNASHAPFLAALLPFLKGFTIFYWATGTLWIPMLVALSIWQHLIKRFPLRYGPLVWERYFRWECIQSQHGRWRRRWSFRFSIPSCRQYSRWRCLPGCSPASDSSETSASSCFFADFSRSTFLARNPADPENCWTCRRLARPIFPPGR